jgi:hypothetical protein
MQHRPRRSVFWTSALVMADRADRLVICNVGCYPSVWSAIQTQVAVVPSHCQDICSNKSMYSSWTPNLSALQISIDSPWHCVCIAWSPNASQSHDTLSSHHVQRASSLSVSPASMQALLTLRVIACVFCCLSGGYHPSTLSWLTIYCRSCPTYSATSFKTAFLCYDNVT